MAFYRTHTDVQFLANLTFCVACELGYQFEP